MYILDLDIYLFNILLIFWVFFVVAIIIITLFQSINRGCGKTRAAKREARLAEAAAGDKPKAGGDLRCGICGYGHDTPYCPHHVPQYYKAAKEVPQPVLDKDNIPKGFALAPMECCMTDSGERYEGPPICVVPMICLKVGDHLPDHCPREITLEDILPPIQSGKLDWFEPDEAEGSF